MPRRDSGGWSLGFRLGLGLGLWLGLGMCVCVMRAMGALARDVKASKKALSTKLSLDNE